MLPEAKREVEACYGRLVLLEIRRMSFQSLDLGSVLEIKAAKLC